MVKGEDTRKHSLRRLDRIWAEHQNDAQPARRTEKIKCRKKHPRLVKNIRLECGSGKNFPGGDVRRQLRHATGNNDRPARRTSRTMRTRLGNGVHVGGSRAGCPDCYFISTRVAPEP